MGGYSGYPYSAAYGYGNRAYAGLGYSGLGYLGARGYYGKRDADAEADPQYLASPYTGYTGYSGYGLGYSGYPYSSAYGYGNNLGYSGLGYAGAGLGYAATGLGARGYYGKRDADAEPQILAGYPYAGAYGYGNLAGYGYAGLGYAGAGSAGLGYGYPYAASVGACRNYLGAAVPC